MVSGHPNVATWPLAVAAFTALRAGSAAPAARISFIVLMRSFRPLRCALRGLFDQGGDLFRVGSIDRVARAGARRC